MNHFLSKWILEGLRTRKIKRRENIMDQNTTVTKNIDPNDRHLYVNMNHLYLSPIRPNVH